MTPDETRECIKKCALAICREENYTDISFTREDLGDGKVTFRFSLTPEKKEKKGEQMSNEVSVIVPTAKSEKAEYVVQFYNTRTGKWISFCHYSSLEKAKKHLEDGERIVKRITIEEVVE